MYNNHFGKRKGRPPIFLIFFVVMLLVLSGIVMLLWNAILPSLLHVNTISYGQSIGLLILCRILFGGFKFGPPGGRSFGPSNRLREKWMGMSDEEKMKFRNEWQKRCRPKQQPPPEGKQDE